MCQSERFDPARQLLAGRRAWMEPQSWGCHHRRRCHEESIPSPAGSRPWARQGDYGNTREVLLTAPFARRAWRAEAGVHSANLRKDHGIVSASGSTELLPAFASCREVSGKTSVGRTLSRRIE